MFEMYSVGLRSEIIPALFPQGPCTLINSILSGPKVLIQGLL